MHKQTPDLRKIPQELKDVCANGLKDDNKKIYLEKIYMHLEKDPKLSSYIWDYNGMPLLLLQEITNTYFVVNTPGFDDEEASKVYVILSILRILVREQHIKRVFVDSMFLYYIYVFLTIYDNAEIYERLSVATLDVVMALHENGDPYIQGHIRGTEIVPLILKNIDLGTDKMKIKAMEVFLQIINSEEGLGYACQTFDRFSVINQVLNSVSLHAVKNSSVDVIRGILMVYIRMCDKSQIRNLLKNKKPENIINEKIKGLCSKDDEAKDLYAKLVGLMN